MRGIVNAEVGAAKWAQTLRAYGLLFLCLAPQAVCVWYVSDRSRIMGGDGEEYQFLAWNVLRQGVYSNAPALGVPPYEPSVDRSPGYPLFLAVIYALLGDSLLAVRGSQLLLTFVTACIVYTLARELVDRSAALVAGLLTATYAPFVFSAMYHLTETLAALLVASFVLLVVTCRKGNGRPRDAAAAGVVAGYLALVRPSFVLLPLLALPLLLSLERHLPLRARARLCLLLAFGFMACIVPWTVRNARVAQRFIPLTAAKGISLYMSAQQYQGELDYSLPMWQWDAIIAERLARMRRADEAVPHDAPRRVSRNITKELLVDSVYTSDALARFRSIPLQRIPLSMVTRVAHLWSTCDMSTLRGLFHRLVQIQFLCLFLLCLAGFWIQRARFRAMWPVWLFPAYVTAIHLVFHMEPRYSLPARPVLLLYAAVPFGLIMARFQARVPRDQPTYRKPGG